MPEDLARRLLLHMEQVHLAAQLAVVALGGLLQHGHVRLEVVAVAEGHAIDALQHGPRRIAQPIGPGDMGQLEGVGGQLPGVLQMRAAAQVLPVAVPVHAQVLTLRDAVDQLQLEGLVRRLVMGNRAVAVPDLGADGFAGVDDLLHLGLDRAQIVGGEGLCPVEIIEPAVIADRADGDLDVRPDRLNRAGHDMGEIVADQLQRLRLVLHRMDGDLAAGRDRPGQVDVIAVQAGGNGAFRKAGRDALGDLGGGHACGIVARVAIGKGEGDLGHDVLLVGLAPTERPVAGYGRAGMDAPARLVKITATHGKPA